MNAKQAKSMIKAIADNISENKDWLTELDTAIGDGDHGINMAQGFGKAIEKIGMFDYELPSEVFKDAAMMLMSAVGGSSGPLFGSFFVKMAMRFRGSEKISPELFGEALSDGVNGVISLGRASVGEKTMLDALTPACEAYKSALLEKNDMVYALTKALEAAKQGVENTIPLIAKRGRISFLGDKTKGHKDPGAASSALIIEAMLKTVDFS